MEKEIIAIIEDINPYAEIDESVNLLEEVIDSVSLFLLVTNLEEKYDVVIEMEEINADNFSTVKSITSLIQGKIK